MARRNTKQVSRRQRTHPARRMLTTMGTILLPAVMVGLASEIFLQAVRSGPGKFAIAYATFRETFSLAVVSLQAVLPVVGALVAAPILLTDTLQDLHGLDSVHEAHRRLLELLFGRSGAGQAVVVKQGRLSAGRDRMVERIGGPATLTVQGDSAVVTEQGGRLKRVLGAGVHALERYERIWETVDLRPQRWVRQVFALTREGIPISCDVDILFQIDDAPEMEQHQRQDGNGGHDEARIHNKEAVLRAAVSRWICGTGPSAGSVNWADRVAALVESALRDILATYRLDWLIRAPQSKEQHPRDEMHQRLTAALKGRMDQVGAKLIHVDLGEIRVKVQDKDASEYSSLSKTLSDIISGQWIDAWHANWKARALASRAEGEAELLRMDTARIEAQAEMIIGLTEILQPTTAASPTSEPYVLALRLFEALQWMSYDPNTRDYMPPEAMRTLRRLQQLLDGEATVSDKGAADGKGEWNT